MELTTLKKITFKLWSWIWAPPKGYSKSRFHAGFSHKSRPEVAWNSCSRQVNPFTLDARLIYHAITHFSYPIPVFALWNMPNNAITLSLMVPLNFPLYTLIYFCLVWYDWLMTFIYCISVKFFSILILSTSKIMRNHKNFYKMFEFFRVKVHWSEKDFNHS